MSLYTLPSWLPADASAHGPALDHHLLLNLWLFLAIAAIAHLILLTGLITRSSTEPKNLWRIEYLPLAILAILFAAMPKHHSETSAAARAA